MASELLLSKLIGEKAVPLRDADDAPDALLEQIGDARFVLLGEASHGTAEFYRNRIEITKRLIEEKGFSAVAVEADFPDAWRVNQFVKNLSADSNADSALSGFNRFPLWMWRNAEILRFVEWLRAHNDRLPPNRKIGFYGLDLYSLHGSIRAVLEYLEKVDPEAARQAQHRYSCFEDFGEDPQAYGYAASRSREDNCEDAVVKQLIELQRRADQYANRRAALARDEFFFAEQNARLVKNAEEYYRQMYRGRVSSWNLRDRHMAETLHALAAHLEAENLPIKIAVWAHNSHLGDARATEMGERGEWNVGQLARERYGDQTFLIGYSTFAGTVAAAIDWDEPAQLKHVRPALENSFERLFHEIGVPNFYLNLRDETVGKILDQPRLNRAIGVIYRPKSERTSHYFNASLARQFDAVIHFDCTRAVEPLEIEAGWQQRDAPETFPEGL